MRCIYLDHLSGTYVNPAVIEYMAQCHADNPAHPGSRNSQAIRMAKRLETAKSQLISFFGGAPEGNCFLLPEGYFLCRMIVTSLCQSLAAKGGHLVLSTIEQPGIQDAVDYLCQKGFTCTRVDVDSEGFIRPEDVENAIQSDTCLIITHVTNLDLGTIQAVHEIGRNAARKNIALYVDAEGGAGWLPLEAAHWNAAVVSASVNRFNGPRGWGLLYSHPQLKWDPSILDVVGNPFFTPFPLDPVANLGAGKAASLAADTIESRTLHVAKLQTQYLTGVRDSIPFLVLNGPEPGPSRVVNNLNLSIEFLEGEGVMLSMDLKGVTIGAGSACVSQTMKIPPALRAIGQDPSLAQGNILVSFSDQNTIEEVDAAVIETGRQVEKLRSMSLSWEQFQEGLRPTLSYGQG